MRFSNGPDAFGLVSRLLHWAIAALILGLIALGWAMVGLDYYDPWYHRAPAIHKATGMVVLGLAMIRIGWVLHSPTPGPLPELKDFERWAAKAVHHLLAAAMVVLPVSGYLISTSAGDGVSVYGLFTLPALVPVSTTVRDAAIALHSYLAYGTLGLATLHAAGALKHHFVDGNDTLRRMLWK